MSSFLNVLGIAGVSEQESNTVKAIQAIHQWVMVVIALVIMLQPYIFTSHLLSDYLFVRANWALWVLFMFGSILLVVLTKHRLHYLLTNWLNLAIVIMIFPPVWLHVSVMPISVVLRPIAIVYLLLPVIRASFQSLSPTQFLQTMLLFVVLTVLAGLFINYIDPAIGGPWRGIWWAFQTITTVGYGNVLPKTFGGQLFSIAFMLVGIGLVATLSASFAYYILKRKGLDQAQDAQDALKAELEEIKKMLRDIRSNQR